MVRLKRANDGRKSHLLVPADEPCAVGTCTKDGVYTVSGYKVCWEHFNAYLNDVIDLEEYFLLREQKKLEALMLLTFNSDATILFGSEEEDEE